MSIQDWQAVANIGQSLTVTGVLALIVWAFFTGNVVSKPVLDKILDGYMREFRERFDKIMDAISDRERSDRDKRGDGGRWS